MVHGPSCLLGISLLLKTQVCFGWSIKAPCCNTAGIWVGSTFANRWLEGNLKIKTGCYNQNCSKQTWNLKIIQNWFLDVSCILKYMMFSFFQGGHVQTTAVCKFQEEICNKAFGFRSAPQGIGSHVLNPKNQAASRCSRATIITQGPSHCTTTSICTCLTYQHQQQPAGISVDAKQIVNCKMRSLLLGTWRSNAIKTRLCIHIMAHCNWANILFQRNDESHERTVPQHVVICSNRSQVDLLASLCCLSICPNPLQPLQSKTEQTSSSFALLPRKSLDKNCMTHNLAGLNKWTRSK